MSTPEPGAAIALPAEADQAARLLPSGPSPAATAAPLPTPGVALAGARVPGAPTVPDWDPAGLAGLIARAASELFAAPPGAAAAPAAAPPAGIVSAPTIGAAPPPVAAPPSAEPFAAPLRLSDLEALLAPAFSVPLLDSPPVAAAPVTAAPVSAAPVTPSSATPPAASPTVAAAPVAAAPPRELTIEAFEIVPVAGPPGSLVRAGGGEAFDPHAVRREFPILQERVHGKRLVWLDSAATTQKPQAVIDRLSAFYARENSNVHRAAHTLAARATDAYESARATARRFLNASSASEIVFVRGATEGINLVAQSWGRRHVGPGDEIVITWLEHHANIVPWQQLCAERGARLRVAPVDDDGQVILEEYERLLGPRTRLVSLTQVSNALGTITPARQMVELAHRHGARVLVDGAQAVSHMPVDVQLLDCDFYVFSGHKVFAPTGIGVVFGKRQVLDETPPWQGGGNMIEDVTFERTRYQPPPARFEAGTGSIADAAGLGAALEWLTRLGLPAVARHEHELLVYATECLSAVPGLRLIGTAPDKAGVLSFVLSGQRTEEVGGLLDQDGIAVRSGHHCAQPILRRFGLEATVRASLAPYNTREDIDALAEALRRLQAGRGRGT